MPFVGVYRVQYFRTIVFIDAVQNTTTHAVGQTSIYRHVV